MPEAHKRLGEEPDARRCRAIMRLTRARARPVGGVLGGEIQTARAVAEQIDGLARQPACGFEVAGLTARLEQSERGARHRRIIVEQCAGAGMSLAPSV